MGEITVTGPNVWPAVVERKRRAAARAEEKAARLRAEADELEAEHVLAS